jgi:hypothetical protein
MAKTAKAIIKKPPKPTSQPSQVTSQSSTPAWYWPTGSRRITQFSSDNHAGALDIGAATQYRIGDPIWSPTRTRVLKTGWDPDGYGLYTTLEALDTGQHIILAHFSALAPNLKVGDTLDPGQVVGLMGNTGRSSGAHLHFEVRAPDGITRLDPAIFYQGGQPQPSRTPIESLAGFRFASGSPLVPASSVMEKAAKTLKIPSGKPTAAVSQKGTDPSATIYNAAGFSWPTQAPGSSAELNQILGRQLLSQTQPPAELVTQKGEPDDIRIAATPFGDISIPRPPLTKWVAIGLASAIILVSILALTGKTFRQAQDKLVKGALDIAPLPELARAPLKKAARKLAAK